MKFTKHSQTATEYMVIVAVVIVIAVIVVGVMGGIPGLAGGKKKQASEAYWISTDIGIPSFAVASDGGYKILLKNNRDKPVAVGSITISSKPVNSDTIILRPGETRFIQGFTNLTGTSGDRYSFPVNITYIDDETGATYNLEGNEALSGSYSLPGSLVIVWDADTVNSWHWTNSTNPGTYGIKEYVNAREGMLVGLLCNAHYS